MISLLDLFKKNRIFIKNVVKYETTAKMGTFRDFFCQIKSHLIE